MNRGPIVADRGVSDDGLQACERIVREGRCHWVRYFSEIDSTNSAACRDLAEGPLTDRHQWPGLYLADSQIAGRGRLGRTWTADQGTLTFSLIHHVGSAASGGLSADALPLVALATGIGIARAIEFVAAPVTTKIKWPNDVYVGGGKVAGVLVESVATRPDCLVIGVGLNVATDTDRLGPGLNQPARSLSDIARGPTKRYQWLPDLVDQMLDAFAELKEGPERLLDELRRRCLLTGKAIRYRVGDSTGFANCVGIDRQGGLLIQDTHGTRSLQSGEVWQIRPN
jgi:BirA family transcriptional regulator, biotin operon repressor / biotin---[acetyl-CoA-carboxylase] ligase